MPSTEWFHRASIGHARDKPCAVAAYDDFLMRMDASATLREAGFCIWPIASANQAIALTNRYLAVGNRDRAERPTGGLHSLRFRAAQA
jgi:hypothetical protein